MQKIDQLDILVVYSASIALSSSVSDQKSKHPFDINSSRANYNLSYAYVLDYCHSLGLTAGFTASCDITGPGTCSSYWTHDSTGWHKNIRPAHSTQIFDKLSPSTPIRTTERNLLLSDASIIPFNDINIYQIFFDKLLTYQQLPKYTIPTVSIYSSRPRDVKSALTRLNKLIKKHPTPNDFSSAVILKDRFGAGGNDIYKISTNIISTINTIMRKHSKLKFVLQPFLIFDQGFTYKENSATTDIRLIIQHNKLYKCYIRVAQDNNFLCNQHQGGKLTYLKNSEIPSTISSTSQKIIKILNKPHSLYALDFVISNTGHVYFIEGNSNPGIDWTIGNPTSEANGQQLIRRIIDEMADRLNNSR